MYSCSEVAKWIASDEYQSAGFLRKLGVRLHLLMCKNCSRYERQLKALAAALRKRSCEIPPSQIDGVKARLIDLLARKS